MDISKIDKNFAVETIKNYEDKFDAYAIPNSKTDLYGVFYENDKFVRLPKEVASNTSEGVLRLYSNTSGGRVRFSTNSKTIGIVAKWENKRCFSHMSATGVCGFTLIENFENGENHYVATFVPPVDSPNGYESQTSLGDEKLRYFTIYFPLYNDVNELYILIDKGCTLDKGLPYKEVKPILYYGSSITQGGCASRPDNSYPAMISKWNNVDYINLGFAGNGRGEESMIKYIASLDVSLFVCDYDHNAPDVEFLKNTHYNVYKTYREINKDTPILFISKPDWFKWKGDAKARFKVIKETYKKAKANGDNNVYLLNGKTFFKKDYDLCTVDFTHPNDLGFYFMAKGVIKKFGKINEFLK